MPRTIEWQHGWDAADTWRKMYRVPFCDHAAPVRSYMPGEPQLLRLDTREDAQRVLDALEQPLRLQDRPNLREDRRYRILKQPGPEYSGSSRTSGCQPRTNGPVPESQP